MTETDVVTKLSPLTVADTTSKLTGMIAAKGMKLFGVIDQAAEARQVGLTLRDTVLVIFGSPVGRAPAPVPAAVVRHVRHRPGRRQHRAGHRHEPRAGGRHRRARRPGQAGG